MKFLKILIAFLLVVGNIWVVTPKRVFAECPEVSANAEISFTYTRNGTSQFYSATADSYNNFFEGLDVDTGTQLTDLSYATRNVYGYGSVDFPNGQYILTDTNGSPYNYNGHNMPNGPLYTDPINSPVYINVTAGQGCNGADAQVSVLLNPVNAAPTPDFSLSCSPATATVSQGSATAASMTTSPQNGFNSGVTFNSSVSPATGNPPTVSFSNNGATPSATTTATITSASNTTPGTYNYTFDGSGGGQTHSCTMQVTVTANPGSFTLSVTPASNDVLKGNSAAFTVTANCAGSFTGPVHSLSASSFFTNVSYSFSSTSVNCGSSVTLTISGTGSVPQNQLSTPQSRLAQTVTVTGLGN